MFHDDIIGDNDIELNGGGGGGRGKESVKCQMCNLSNDQVLVSFCLVFL